MKLPDLPFKLPNFGSAKPSASAKSATAAGAEVVAPAAPSSKSGGLAALAALSDQQQLTLVLVVAVGCASVAGLSTMGFLKKLEYRAREVSVQSRPVTATVVVARQDINPGEVVDRLMVQTSEWPQGQQPDGGFADVEALQGRLVKTKIFRGEPILDPRLVPQGEKGGLQVRIPEGMRAMSLKIDPEIGVSGFIKPGTRVDVIVTIRTRDPGVPPMSKVALQNLLVLAVEQEMEEDAKAAEATTVTVAVTPEDAEKLAAARNEGTIMLALRNQRDDVILETPGFSSVEWTTAAAAVGPPPESFAESTGGAQGAVADNQAAAAPSGNDFRVVQLISGDTRTEERFKAR